ncbi:MAG: hypothetical protein IPN69_07055 [Acidobacteria bacterium]|nr:hypothetical protein [Acidobacteriota bacterium]MBK8147298.1 hypothetical protein [Acidobacteriota bacterium]MBK8810481.1 hypothetical protein [Acidobacteriota bacterium]
MSFTLMDLSSENFEFQTNVWHWKTALEIIKSFDLISEGKVRQMAYNGTGFKLEREDAHLIGEKIRDEILPRLAPNKRIFADLTITDQPDDGTLYRDGDEQWKNYSATYDWLKDFSEFCLRSKGFQIY